MLQSTEQLFCPLRDHVCLVIYNHAEEIVQTAIKIGAHCNQNV